MATGRDTGSGPGVELRRYRERTGLTQEGLAEASGVSVRTIRGLEAGRIRAPHRPTLLAVAAGLDLDQRHTSGFVDLWRRDREVLSFSDMLDPAADVDAMIARFGERKEVKFQHLSWTARMVVGPDRQSVYRQSEYVNAALVDGVDSLMFMFGGDPTLDCEKVVVRALRGCTLGELIPLPETNEVLFFLDLGHPLEVGETVTPAYRVDLSAARLTPEQTAAKGIPYETSTGASWTLRTPVDHFLAVVEFRGVEPPTSIWEVAADGGVSAERRRVRRLHADEFGTVHLIARHAAKGLHGFEWEWDDSP